MGVVALNAIEKALLIFDDLSTVFAIIFNLALNVIMALQALVPIEKARHCFVHIGRIRMMVVQIDVAVALEASRFRMYRLL
jgi:hypothetical protein